MGQAMTEKHKTISMFQETSISFVLGQCHLQWHDQPDEQFIYGSEFLGYESWFLTFTMRDDLSPSVKPSAHGVNSFLLRISVLSRVSEYCKKWAESMNGHLTEECTSSNSFSADERHRTGPDVW